MDKDTYSRIINEYQNADTRKLIGDIDIETLFLTEPESLYYSLPLIERIVLEIYKLVPEADIEFYNQGRMNTIMPMVEKNKKLNVIPNSIIEMLLEIYKEDGISNTIFHPSENSQYTISVSFEKINVIILELLKILNNKLEECDNYNVEKIETI